MVRAGVSRLTFSILGAFLWFAGSSVLGSAHAETPLAIDDDMQSVRGWNVGFSRGMRGCLASASFTDGTTVWIGFSAQFGPLIAFTNARWQSLQVERSYNIEVNARSYGRWRGSFLAIARNSERGLINAGLKTEFLLDLARSESMSVAFEGRQITQVSLSGSRAALEEAIECQKRHGTEAAARPSPQPSPRSADKGGGSSGTGFFVSREGHVVTNQHVVADCKAFEVNRPGAAPETARLVAKDNKNDLALLKTALKPEAVPGLRTRIRLGENVAVYGFPLTGLLATSGNFTLGNVTALAGMADDSTLLQISAPVQPGNSGGPLIDSNGNVVGVIVSKLNALGVAQATKDLPQNVNFAIKAAIAANFLESNGVSPLDGTATKVLDNADLADKARQFTVRVVCK